MELSFCDLRAKEVINVCDGRRLGNIIDLIIDCHCAQVVGIVVPYDRTFFSFFKSCQDIFIPWNRICKIGRDVILVELTPINMPIGCNAQTCSTPVQNINSVEYQEAKPQNKNSKNNQQNANYNVT